LLGRAIDPVKRNVSWVRAWCNGVVTCHLVSNVFTTEAPHNVFIYARTLDGKHTTLKGFPSVGQWPQFVQAYIHPTLGYFILLFTRHILVWDLSRHQSSPMVDIGAMYSNVRYTSVWCDDNTISVSISGSPESIVMWRWLSLARGPTTLVQNGSCDWTAVSSSTGAFACHVAGPPINRGHYQAGPNYYHHLTTSYKSGYVWISYLHGPGGLLRSTETPVDIGAFNNPLSRWWSDLMARIEVRRAREREAAAADAKAKKKELERLSATTRHFVSHQSRQKKAADDDDEDEDEDDDDNED
jgi:hypothetical protein